MSGSPTTIDPRIDHDTRRNLARLARVLRYAVGIWYDDVPEAAREAVLDALHDRAADPLVVTCPAAIQALAAEIEAVVAGEGEAGTTKDTKGGGAAAWAELAPRLRKGEVSILSRQSDDVRQAVAVYMLAHPKVSPCQALSLVRRRVERGAKTEAMDNAEGQHHE
jgi:hypothetical protein